MTRNEIYQEMEQMLGLVPTFFKVLPDSSIELEWQLFKRIQVEESAIPAKYRELIGLGISAVTKCRYCAYFHTEMAKLFGATDAEIEDAVHYAKSSAGMACKSITTSLPGKSTRPVNIYAIPKCRRKLFEKLQSMQISKRLSKIPASFFMFI